MRFAAFIVLCLVICGLAASAPLGFWTWVPIVGLALVASFVLPESGYGR